MNFIEELKWRGMIHDIMPGTEEQLAKEMTVAYVGIDPTADSLHIGHLVSIMMLKHFQLAGHKPIALVGGATGMIGDPSGKSEERNLLSEEVLRFNEQKIKEQLLKFLDFNSSISNAAEIVNNYDWMKHLHFLGFLRDIGKHLTVNYMLAKDSVQKRLDAGISFTEFSYQLVQAYDFLHLYETMNCKLQMGGSDQWGNITSGTELIRRKANGNAFAITCPLITKSDGGKFGKTEEGNIWLSPDYTSPYKFYQFWLNTSDDDAEKYIKIFTLLKRDEIENLINNHKSMPHKRLLQQTLAKETTIMVHSTHAYNTALEASQILFGDAGTEMLIKLEKSVLLSALEGVPRFTIGFDKLSSGINIMDLISVYSQILPSRSEARRLIQSGGLIVNKNKVDSPEFVLNTNDLIAGNYILIQKGKKNYFLIIAE